MENKELIITLIRADIKHNQLISGLECLHLQTDMYFLTLYEPVAVLMGVKDSKTSDRWFTIYDKYLQQANRHEVTSRGENLLPIAEECYNLLKACLDTEKLLGAQDDG